MSFSENSQVSTVISNLTAQSISRNLNVSLLHDNAVKLTFILFKSISS